MHLLEVCRELISFCNYALLGVPRLFAACLNRGHSGLGMETIELTFFCETLPRRRQDCTAFSVLNQLTSSFKVRSTFGASHAEESVLRGRQLRESQVVVVNSLRNVWITYVE